MTPRDDTPADGPVRGWAAIETAPRDGSLFVGLYRWSARDKLRAAICSYDRDAGAFCEGADGVFLDGVVHWMPLPPAPVQP